MPNSGQVLNVLVCSATPPGAAAGQIFGPADSALCPSGFSAYLVESFIPYSTSADFFDGLAKPFDPVAASVIFSFAFGVVVTFWIIGLKSSVLIRPFFRGR